MYFFRPMWAPCIEAPVVKSIYNARGVGGWVSGWVSESVTLFFPWAGEVVVSFD